jgi:hypothetical protein
VATTTVLSTKPFFIQGASITSGAANVAGISALYPVSNAGSNWTISQTVMGTGAGTNAVFGVYYYAVN